MTINNNTSSDGTCDINHPLCLSPFVRDPYETNYAVLVPRCTGLLSAISSALIITIILRSSTGLTTIYHRIMFGLSAADIISSLAISLTTLPMPRYMPREEEYGFYWAGTRLGNSATCSAQGFFFSLGIVTTFAYSGSLCVYYGCAVALAMKEDKIKKYVEPILHLWAIGIGLLISIPPLFLGMYNPSNVTLSWCGTLAYPEGCGFIGDVECVRGSANSVQVTTFILLVIMILDFSVITITMLMVVAKAIQTNQVLKLVYQNLRNRTDTTTWHQQIEFQRQAMLRQNNVQATIIHALSYIFAFLISSIVPFLDNAKIQDYPKHVQVQLDKAKLLLLPSQGFFNFFIFTSLKVYSYHRTNEGTSILATFVKVLIQSNQEPCYISRISIVNDDRNEDDARHSVRHSAVIDLTDYSNEGCEANHPPDKNAHTKHYLFSMSDESGNSALQYRIKLFTSAFLDVQNESVNSNADAPYHADHAADVMDNKAEDFVDHSVMGSNSRISYDIKSDETSIYVEETSKPKVPNKAFTASHHPFSSNESESSNKSHGLSVGESDIKESVNDSDADEYQSVPRISYSVKSEGTIKAEEQRRDLIRRLFHQDK